MWAISGTSGSSGLGSVNREHIDSSTWIQKHSCHYTLPSNTNSLDCFAWVHNIQNSILTFQKHLKCCLESARCPTVCSGMGYIIHLFTKKSISIRETIDEEKFPFQSHFLSHLTRNHFCYQILILFLHLFQEGEAGSEEIAIQKSRRITDNHIKSNNKLTPVSVREQLSNTKFKV